MGRFDWKLVFGKTVLVYQMPKVGSQTVEATLRACAVPHHLYRFHYLSPASAQRLRQALRWSGPDAEAKKSLRGQLRLRAQIVFSLRVRRMLCASGFPVPPLYVITAVRDLLGCALSSLFENQSYFVSTPEQMTPAVCRRALMHPKTLPALDEWFDVELKPQIGIDVYETPFPTGRGYALYNSRFARVLLYRFDLLPKLAPVLESFLNHPIPKLVSVNVASSKPYGERYRSVQSELWLPERFLDEQLASRTMAHFFSPSERDSIKATWLEKLHLPDRKPRDRSVSGEELPLQPVTTVCAA